MKKNSHFHSLRNDKEKDAKQEMKKAMSLNRSKRATCYYVTYVRTRVYYINGYYVTLRQTQRRLIC